MHSWGIFGGEYAFGNFLQRNAENAASCDTGRRCENDEKFCIFLDTRFSRARMRRITGIQITNHPIILILYDVCDHDGVLHIA